MKTNSRSKTAKNGGHCARSSRLSLSEARDQVSAACFQRCLEAYFSIRTYDQQLGQLGLFVLGFVLLLSASSEPALAYDGSKYLGVCNNLVGLAEGGFGAMLTAIAGVGAIIASAMGGFKMAWACVVVSVGAFILRAYIQLFFENCGS